MSEHLLAALASILGNKVRAALTTSGIVIGVLAITLLVSVGDGARSYIENTLTGIGTNLLFITPGRTETRGALAQSGGASTARPLTMDDLRTLERHGSLLRGLSPIVEGRGAMRYAMRERDARVFGVGPSFCDLRGMHVGIGEFVRAEDVEARRRVAVLGRTVVRELFGEENPLGKVVRIANGRFRVIGIMEAKGRSLGFDLDDLAFIPATSAQDLFSQDVLTSMVTATRNKDDIPAAIEQIEEVLSRRRNGEKTFSVRSQDDVLSTFSAMTSAMTWVLLAIASISLVVGAIGIMNIMLVSVRERTREIGVRRALGATRRDILLQFLTESVVIAAVGGAIGLLLGCAIVVVVHRTLPAVPVALSPWIAAVAFGSSFLVGIASGVVPARHAAAYDPVEALRYE